MKHPIGHLGLHCSDDSIATIEIKFHILIIQGQHAEFDLSKHTKLIETIFKD